MGAYFGGWPVHKTFAFHWARLIEVLHAAEKMVELISSPELLGTKVRTLPDKMKKSGIGVCEAPRGTLIHHYNATGSGLVRDVNLLVATQNNGAAIQLSLKKAAQALITDDKITEDIKNILEMVFRAYDPCMAGAAH
jgi:F420-non-reducing hydrogenase large subunit